MSTTSAETALPSPPTDPKVLTQLETSPSLTFPEFTSQTAFNLGLALRQRILSLPSSSRKPALISIALTNGEAGTPQVVFQCTTEPGTTPDNHEWVRRKRNAVIRFGTSSWGLRMKMLASTPSAEKVEAAFVAKFGLKSFNGGSVADDYAIHGGGFPIRVDRVEGVIGVIVVSGLKQEDDHQVVVEVVKEFVESNRNSRSHTVATSTV